MAWHGETCGNKGGVFPLFSPDSDDRLSLNFHRIVIWYISCDTRSVGLGHYCLPKVSNGFNKSWCTNYAIPPIAREVIRRHVMNIKRSFTNEFSKYVLNKMLNNFCCTSIMIKTIKRFKKLEVYFALQFWQKTPAPTILFIQFCFSRITMASKVLTCIEVTTYFESHCHVILYK